MELASNLLRPQPTQRAKVCVVTPVDHAALQWAEALMEYARDWDRTFGNRESYFTQEYWYLFVGCLLNDWRGTPLTVSDACKIMRTGSNRTREARIKRAVLDGYLEKRRTEVDKRSAVVIPSARLEAAMRGHINRTMATMRSILR
ncbi:MAG: hypothetical protein FJ196_05245 [Gammaproteobacteria bacterium]|nr:hypothetical protein [Gammaproteobacteria bacterium]